MEIIEAGILSVVIALLFGFFLELAFEIQKEKKFSRVLVPKILKKPLQWLLGSKSKIFVHCPRCGSGKPKPLDYYDSRGGLIRKRQCSRDDCGHIFWK